MKDKRLLRIREIVSQREVETQEELIRLLEESGFSVTQATISRDIKELQLIKVVGSTGRYKYAIPMAGNSMSTESLRRKLSEVFISLARANNLIVLRVLPGNAHSIGAVIDGMNMPGVLGTIAGDDTLLLICADEDSAVNLVDWVSAP